jgi:hypothetical protein
MSHAAAPTLPTSFAGDSHNALTRRDAPPETCAPEMAQSFACPRCARDVTERFYGPCEACRLELRRTAQPLVAAAVRGSGGRWAAIGGGRRPAHLGELVRVAEALDVEQLWLTAGALEAWGLPTRPTRGAHAFVADAEAEGWTTNAGGELRGWLRIWRRGEPGGATVSVPAWDAGGSPWVAAEPAQLVEQLERFAAVVGAPWSYSGAITSDGLVRELHRRRGGLRLEPTTAPPALEVDEVDYHWRRSPLEGEGGRWCHAFDVNGMYLSAASSLALPTGEPTHLERPAGVDKRPGWWRLVPAAPAPGYPDVTRPAPPRRRDVDEGGAVWCSTPVAQLAAELGAELLEAWVWPQHHQHLAGWYKRLRDARLELLEGGDEMALAAVKATYRAGIGRLSSTRRTTSEPELEQPQWRAQLIGMARARWTRRLNSTPAPPIAVDVDCAWWITDTAEPLEAAAQLGLPIGEGLGQLRPVGSLSGAQALELLADELAPRALAQLREVTA